MRISHKPNSQNSVISTTWEKLLRHVVDPITVILSWLEPIWRDFNSHVVKYHISWFWWHQQYSQYFEISKFPHTPPHYGTGFNVSENLKYYRFCQDFEESRTSAIVDVSYSLYTFFDHFPSKYRWCNIEIPKKLKIFKLMLLCQKCLRLLGMASKLTHIQFLCVTIVIVLPHTLIIAIVSHNSPFSFKFPFDVEIPNFFDVLHVGEVHTLDFAFKSVRMTFEVEKWSPRL